MKKLLTCLCALALTFNSSTIMCFADNSESNAQNDNDITENEYYVVEDAEGTVVSSNLPSVILRSGNHSTYEVIATGHVDWVYAGYHPDCSIWRRVAAYYFTTSQTVTMSVSVGGGVYINFGISAYTTYSTSYRVDTDQNRSSKIEVYIDYDYKDYRVTTYDDTSGAVVGTYEYRQYTKSGEYFIPHYAL